MVLVLKELTVLLDRWTGKQAIGTQCATCVLRLKSMLQGMEERPTQVGASLNASRGMWCPSRDVKDQELAMLRREKCPKQSNSTCKNQVVGESMPSSGIWPGLSLTIAQVGAGVSQGAVVTRTLDRAPLGSYLTAGTVCCFASPPGSSLESRKLILHLYMCCLAQTSSNNWTTYRLFCSQPKACLTQDSPATYPPASRGS